MPSRYASALRTKLRSVNMEFSALVRDKSSGTRFVRLAELKAERSALMALIHGMDPANGRRAIGVLSSRMRRRNVGSLQAAE